MILFISFAFLIVFALQGYTPPLAIYLSIASPLEKIWNFGL